MSARVGVMIACHNRRDVTLRCLDGLASQRGIEGLSVEVYLTDDGSTDGTAHAVRQHHPEVVVLDGDGSLFWGGGMRMAEAAARAAEPDYLLWLNDDVALADDCVKTMVALARDCGGRAVVVGAVADPVTGSTTYGGHRRVRGGRPLDLELVEPNGSPQPVDTMNGNLVLIPAAVHRVVGSIDVAFSHNMADMDYGFRVRAAGFQLVLTPRVVGTCSPNPAKRAWRDGSLPVARRVGAILAPTGLPPREWLRFTLRYCGWRWPRYFLGPYVHAVVARWVP